MVVAIVLGPIVLFFFVLVIIGVVRGLTADDEAATRPLLTQEVRPGAAYRYGPAGIYNACSLVTLDDLRRRGLVPAPDQHLREYYPVADQPEETLDAGGGSSGPSDCHVFIEMEDKGQVAEGNVQVEVLQGPYTHMEDQNSHLARYEREGGSSYIQDGTKVVIPPPANPDIFGSDHEEQIAAVYIAHPAAVVEMVVAFNEVGPDPFPILKKLVASAIQRLSAPPAREMALSYTPSDGDEPDACEVLAEEDVRMLLAGPPKGFVHRSADLAERRIWLNNGQTTYFSQTECERGLVRALDAILDPPDTAALTLRGYHDVESAQATMRQILDPHGSGFGPPVVLPVIGDDPGAVTPSVYGDRKVVFRAGRYVVELDYRDGTENADNPDILAQRVTPVAQAIANRLR